MQSHPAGGFELLPAEVKLSVFAYLDEKELCLLSGVSKQWRDLLSDDYLWRSLFIVRLRAEMARKAEKRAQKSNGHVISQLELSIQIEEAFAACRSQRNSLRKPWKDFTLAHIRSPVSKLLTQLQTNPLNLHQLSQVAKDFGALSSMKKAASAAVILHIFYKLILYVPG